MKLTFILVNTMVPYVQKRTVTVKLTPAQERQLELYPIGTRYYQGAEEEVYEEIQEVFVEPASA